MSDTPIPLEQATSLVRPDNGPWVWSEPVQAIVSDSGKWRHWPDFHDTEGPYEWRVARSAIENLYRCGYALVKVADQ